MVNFDGLVSAFYAWIKITATSMIRRLRTGAVAVREATHPTMKTITAAVSPRLEVVADAVSPRLKVVADAVSPRLKVVADAVSPPIRAFNAASPKVKAICASCALVVLTGILAPIAVTEFGHDAYAADNVAVVPDGTSNPKAAAGSAKAPTFDQLHPTGIQSAQSDLSLSTEQMRNAQKIIQAGQTMGLPSRAWLIAIATSMQESKLTNLGYLGAANDYDSLGLFQQRPSSGWGSAEQLQDPAYAAKAFYGALTRVPGWDQMNLADAAQAVQVSAFGDRYAQWEAKAGDVVNAFYGQGPLTDLATKVM
jgi:hypothetical protein